MDTQDQTGLLVTLENFDEAIKTVSNQLIGASLLKLPPELAVGMGNILRCLGQGQMLTRMVIEKQRQEQP